LGEGLQDVNAELKAHGAKPIAGKVAIRVTTDSKGSLIAAEPLTADTPMTVAETVAKQALKSAQGVEAGAAGAAAKVSPWVRGAGWVGTVVFVAVTAYRLKTATPEEVLKWRRELRRDWPAAYWAVMWLATLSWESRRSGGRC
jgi:hypothetical protein